VRAALKQLVQIATAPDPSFSSVALEGRRIAEVVIRELSRGAEPAGDGVSEDIEDLALAAPDRVEPELRLLLEQGRAAASGTSLDAQDAMLIVRAALRVAERTASAAAG
jgi:hypothetical protein